MESLTGLLAAIDVVLASPGVGSDFSITESLMTGIASLMEQLAVFMEQFSIMEALGALGIF